MSTEKPPPLLIILLWQHFCYYKRHKILLAVSILLPFILLGILAIFVWQFTSGSLGKSSYYSETRQQTVSLLSSGFLQYVEGGADYNCYQTDFIPPYPNQYSNGNPNVGYAENYTDQSILDFVLSEQVPGQTPICHTESIYLQNGSCDYTVSLNNNNYTVSHKYDPTIALMFGYILYYPLSSQKGTSVMNTITKTLQSYALLQNQSPLDVSVLPLPAWNALDYFANISTECWVEPDERIIGFDSLNDLLAFSQNNLSALNDSLYSGNGNGPIPQLWGAVNFEDTDENFKNHKFQYSLLYESGYMTVTKKDIWLQDLIEQAAVKLVTGNDTLPITPTFKELPSKCWIRPPGFIYQVLQTWLSLMITVGFFLMPTTFLILIVQEKQLKLREYLYIMGVTDLFLKFSWMTFFLIFLIPMAIISSIIVIFMPGGIFLASDPSVLFVIFILFTLSQLCWVYLLSTIMQSPARAGFIVGFFNIFFSAFSSGVYVFGQGKLTGSFLVITRILSLHTSVPFSLAMSYFVGWEAIWTGAEWKYFFYTPTVGDGYNGFGECICWMIGDSFLYIFLAWYFQHLLPGEYGVKYPFYFLFLPSFWCPKRYGQEKVMNASEESRADIETLGQNYETGVMLEQLTKHYNKDKVGIDKLSVSFFKNQITAFLGENGAGKTTTMNILVGLINPTGGSAWIHGLNVSQRMSEIRNLIAFVPQYDILYPSMTVEEHIQFFGWLQNLSKAQIWKSMDRLLKSFDLVEQKKTLTTDLSGGQKRKLSILTAYIRNPEIIILDEPTSGVDPYSRKAIWEIISQHRKNSTTILSTHYMQEADILGDRIAIISLGKLQCVGSGMYLKNRYGQGYRLTVATNPNHNSSNQVESFLQKRIPETKLVQESGNDKTYTIPMEIAQSNDMVNLLQSIEQYQTELGIVSFGVTEPSLEEVFFAATGARHNITGEKPHYIEGAHVNVDAESKIHHEPSSFLSQFATLFIKRVLLTIRTPSVLVLQILLPLILVAVMLIIDNGFNTLPSQSVVEFYADFRENVFFFQDHGGMGNEFLNVASHYGLSPLQVGLSNVNLSYPSNGYLVNGSCSCDSYCPAEQSLSYQGTKIPSKDLIYPLDSFVNVSDWILHANQTNHWIIGGFEFFQLNSTVYDFNAEINYNFNLIGSTVLNETTTRNYSVIWTTPQLNTAMLNAFNNMLLRYLKPDWSIIMMRQVADLLPPSKNIASQVASLISSLLSSYFLIMAYIFATFGVANIVQYERSKGLKRMQFIAGANPIAYWCANLVWDFIQLMVTIALTFILLVVVSNPFNNASFNDLGNLTIILLPFAVGTMAFTYLMSFVFETPQALNRMISLVGFIAMIVATFLAIFSVTNDLGLGNYSWANYVSYVGCLFPYYYVSEAVSYMSMYQTLGSTLKQSYTAAGFKYDTNLLNFDQLGRRIMEGWISATLLFVAVILLEYTTYSISSGKLAKSTVAQEYRKIIDADVLVEEEKVLTNSALNDPLIVRQVYKVYPKNVIPAVNGVSFSIPRGQCFGLLGINGAGKTSLFKILAGFSGPTSGTASIEAMDIRQNFRRVGNHMGYCPQDNTLFDQLTPKEHLILIGRLRGIPQNELNVEVDRLMLQVGLEMQSKKHSSQMSGGNQRKLQFAISLLDYRPVIFLDEPTTGMDPSARRMAWNSIIDAVARGCSIVLTSHSMEECEVLCHRLVIMVLGNFSCIGSVQYLKSKFGNRYTFKVKLSPVQDASGGVELKDYFKQHLPTAAIIEEHRTLLVYEIAADGLLISSLFQILCNSKKKYPALVEDFTTSQVSLEHVFVNMAERQQLLQAGLPVKMDVP